MRRVLFILGQLTDDDIDWLISAGTLRRVPAGTVVVERGRPVDAVSVVLEGHLQVGGPGEPAIARLGPGEIVGEISFVDSRPPTATVVALDDSALLVLPEPALREHLAADPAFAARFYRAIAVFLAGRMRGAVARFGYGSVADEAAPEGDDLDPDVLDGVHLAGARFRRLVDAVLGR